MKRLTRRLHRLHRALGSVLCALLVIWFVSGAVMTFSAFPFYSRSERLRDLAPLPTGLVPHVPPQLADWLRGGALGSGALRLVNIADQPRWLSSGTETPQAVAARAGAALAPLTTAQARAVAERVLGARAESVELLYEQDQWTAPQRSGAFPLLHVRFADAVGSELYVSQANGEIVQRTERNERILAWLGAIPHWIYPTALRKHRDAWKYTVITLASFGLGLTLSGLWIGIGTQRQLARRAHPRPLRDAKLRWHQRIGLGFGALVAAWLLSGILSFTPFAWTQAAEPWRHAEASLGGVFPSSALVRIGEALSRCQDVLRVHQLSLRSLAGVPLAVCSGGDGRSLLVRLDQASLMPVATLDAALRAHVLEALRNIAPVREAVWMEAPDLYYYPTHADPDLALPVLRLQLGDAARSVLYLDAHTGSLAALHTDRTRLERWLFHGLHSLDVPALYARVGMWRGVVWTAMSLGAALAGLGLVMTLRRMLRRRAARRSLRARPSP